MESCGDRTLMRDIECSNRMSNINNNTVITEAQLRWAQFHSNKRTHETKRRIERLYQNPLTISDVPTASSNDDRSFTSCSSVESSNLPLSVEINNNIEHQKQSNDNYSKTKTNRQQQRRENNRKQKRYPVVSCGRRALLRVSKRNYEQRRQSISQFGYRYEIIEDEQQQQQQLYDDDYNNNRTISSPLHVPVSSTAAPNDVLEQIFQESLKQPKVQGNQRKLVLSNKSKRIVPTKKYRSSMRHRRPQHLQDHRDLSTRDAIDRNDDNNEEERVHRFEHALHLMMSMSQRQMPRNHDKDNNDKYSAGTYATAKKWTRPEGVRSYYIVDEVTSIMRQQTTDIKRSRRHRQQGMGRDGEDGSNNNTINSARYYAQAMRDLYIQMKQDRHKRNDLNRNDRSYNDYSSYHKDSNDNHDHDSHWDTDYNADDDNMVRCLEQERQNWLQDDSNRGYVQRIARQLEDTLYRNQQNGRMLNVTRLIPSTISSSPTGGPQTRRTVVLECLLKYLAQLDEEHQHIASVASSAKKNISDHDENVNNFDQSTDTVEQQLLHLGLVQYLIDNVDEIIVTTGDESSLSSSSLSSGNRKDTSSTPIAEWTNLVDFHVLQDMIADYYCATNIMMLERDDFDFDDSNDTQQQHDDDQDQQHYVPSNTTRRLFGDESPPAQVLNQQLVHPDQQHQMIEATSTTCSTTLSEQNARFNAYAAFRQKKQSPLGIGQEQFDAAASSIDASSFSGLPSIKKYMHCSVQTGLQNAMNSIRNAFDDEQKQLNMHSEVAENYNYENDNHDSENGHPVDDESDHDGHDDVEISSSQWGMRLSSSTTQFEPERLRNFVDGLNNSAQNSRRLHDRQNNIIDTDDNGDGADSNIDDDDESNGNRRLPNAVVANLLLSPTILTKRHQQAIRAIENRTWDQVRFILSANPWLAEMTDIASNSYLLHKLAFYGAGQLEDLDLAQLSTIEETNHNELTVSTVTATSSNSGCGNNNSKSSHGSSQSTRPSVAAGSKSSTKTRYRYQPAPDTLNTTLINLFPAAVYKFDQDGNVPLHWAASSANVRMIALLGERFPEGASVQNHHGMLPLHLAVLACATMISPTTEISPKNNDKNAEHSRTETAASDVIHSVLQYFPGAIAVCDNEGNLPIHLATSVLQGSIGAEVVHYLVTQFNIRQRTNSNIRRSSQVGRTHHGENEQHTDIEITTIRANLSRDDDDNNDDHYDNSFLKTNCLLIPNKRGDTPLLAAIKSKAGYNVIEAIISSGGEETRPRQNDTSDPLVVDIGINDNNVLQSQIYPALTLLLIQQNPQSSPESVIALLKMCPEVAATRNEEGILPIEFACMHMHPRDVVLSLVILDLPIILNETHTVVEKHGGGGSWWYLNCDCDDYYVDVVEDVLSLCNIAQVRAMCLMIQDDLGLMSLDRSHKKKKFGSAMTKSLLSRATPRCRAVIQSALRFVGRYEILENPDKTDSPSKSDYILKSFDAIDFGSNTYPIPDGKSVRLDCHSDYESFLRRIQKLRYLTDDCDYIEEIRSFDVDADYWNLMTRSDNATTPKFFVAIDIPYMTLIDVVHGLLDNELCQSDVQVRLRYTAKVFSVLRLIVKGLRRLHSLGLVHGNVTLKNCAKYDDQKWKVANFLGCYKKDEILSISAIPISSMRVMPPEGFIMNNKVKTSHASQALPTYDDIRMNKIAATTSMDSWAFGKLAYEVLTGQPLFRSDSMLFPEVDVGVEQSSIDGLIGDIYGWSVETWSATESAARKLLEKAKVPKSGISLIVQCLSSDPKQRPQMDEIIHHPVWNDLRKIRI